MRGMWAQLPLLSPIALISGWTLLQVSLAHIDLTYNHLYAYPSAFFLRVNYLIVSQLVKFLSNHILSYKLLSLEIITRFNRRATELIIY